MTQTVLITGASGLLGRNTAKAFSTAGWQVRRFQRGQDLSRAAAGVDVIVNGMNPPNYHNWARFIPEITQAHIAAARISGATVILPGNVYGYGAQPGPWTERTPPAPVSRKGRIRVDMEAAYRAAGIRTIVLRAGNFIDPEGRGDILQLMHLRHLPAGKITTPGDPEVAQAWCYLPDWAQAACALADRRADLATFEDVPFAGHTFSVSEMTGHLSSLLGTDLRIAPFPWWLLGLARPVWELAREMTEMRYLWDLDHRLDGGKLQRLLPGFRATDLSAVLERAARVALPAARVRSLA